MKSHIEGEVFREDKLPEHEILGQIIVTQDHKLGIMWNFSALMEMARTEALVKTMQELLTESARTLPEVTEQIKTTLKEEK